MKSLLESVKCDVIKNVMKMWGQQNTRFGIHTS